MSNETMFSNHFKYFTETFQSVLLWILFILVLGGLLFFIKKISKAIELLKEASNLIRQTKSALLVPLSVSFSQSLLIGWCLMVGCLLASGGNSAQWRVVNSCSQETCVNTRNQLIYGEGDLCDKDTFK